MKPLKTPYFLSVLIGLLGISLPIFAQESQPRYVSKMANLGEIQMEYYDHGGTGPLLIEVQDFHNYYEGPYYRPDSPGFDFLEELTQDFHVVAPMRRGYGKSTDTKWGMDVATLGKDLLLFMDALGVEKAFFYGRFPGSQELTWIAEHHPERVLGLIYFNNPIVLVECSDLEVIEYFENISVFTPDFDKEKLQRIMGSRAMWRPDFLTNEELRIDVPALRFINPEFERFNFNLAMFESGEIKIMSEEEFPGREKEQQYLKELLADSIRYNQMYEKLKACNLTDEIEEGMKRAFGGNLITRLEQDFPQKLDSEQAFADYLIWQAEHILAFKEEVMKE
ncbi:alpha/beta hydrolase [Algoriphagus sp. CAU 1675]|uniref:alpha/beta fold hydrolase n=1 Tax=Algoriphagus sp. CAU 1675 TaxID=3032597 RepID=UPI0023DCB2D2|nr:alpha/beta hydrolase [Algoriphagus sp. CAU 1675]